MAPAPNRKGDKAKKHVPSPMAKKTKVSEFTEESARKLLVEKEREKQQSFLNEYQALCEKHGYEVTIAPYQLQLTIKPFNKQ